MEQKIHLLETTLEGKTRRCAVSEAMMPSFPE